jgi:peptidoglycan/xylan/chitin deacetylase (PgdA/CDA1 family)
MYHDVVDRGAEALSGFTTADADLYKVDPEQFAAHLKALTKNRTTGSDIAAAGDARQRLFVTFDDGGRSAYTHIAPQLELNNWRGHFFVATDYIDTKTFLTSDQIRDLDGRGHIIGSHSASHPLRMAAATDDAIFGEWRRSLEKLSDILKKRPSIASIPGGLYSNQVAAMASRAGIRKLFTSEPTTRTWQVAETICYGRYTIKRNTSPGTVAAIAGGEATPWLRQWLSWNVKKIAKSAAGHTYLDLRRWWFTD